MEHNIIEEPAPVAPQPSKILNLAIWIWLTDWSILELLGEDSIINCYPIYGGGNPPPSIHGYFRAGKRIRKLTPNNSKNNKKIRHIFYTIDLVSLYR